MRKSEHTKNHYQKKINKEQEDEKLQNMMKKRKLKEENEKLIEASERAREENKKLKEQQKLQDLKYSKEYFDIFDRQEQAKKQKLQEIKSKVENQPRYLPKEREKNIYGLSVQEEEQHMLNRMK